ncbi:unnamed protein product [Caretta caretta]
MAFSWDRLSSGTPAWIQRARGTSPPARLQGDPLPRSPGGGDRRPAPASRERNGGAQGRRARQRPTGSLIPIQREEEKERHQPSTALSLCQAGLGIRIPSQSPAAPGLEIHIPLVLL